MILNKGNILKLIITPILLLSLSGCFEHTNESCIEKAEEVTITYKSCKDQNKFLTETNFHVLDAKSSPYYDTSGGLSESEVTRLNNNAINAENNLAKLYEIQMYVADIVLSLFVYATFIIVPIGLYRTIQRAKEGKPHKVYFSLTMFLIISSFTYYVVSSNHFTRSIAGSLNAVSQVLFTANVKLSLTESQQKKAQIKSFSKNELLEDARALIHIGVCLNNNQRNTLERQQIGVDLSSDKLISQKDVVDFYYKKNVPYVKYYDKRTNKKISYTINKFGLIHKIFLADCGEITANNKQISSAVFNIMEEVNFNSITHNAIKNKTLESSWNEIQTAYEEKYLMTENAKLRLMQLAIIYLLEYKKGFIIGSVELGYDAGKNPDYLAGTQKYIDFDSSNLQSFLTKTDAIYDNINESICITNAELVKETINDLEDFDTTSFMSQYDCVNFDKENGTFSAATTSNKIYDNNNKQEIETNIVRLVNKTNPLVEDSVEDLIAGYAAIDDLFIEIVDSLYSFEEDVGTIINKGYFAQGDFYHYLNTNTNGYLSMYSELNDVLDISYAKALPNYATGDDNVESNLHAYTSGHINYFLNPIFDQIDVSLSVAPSSYSSQAIEIATDSSRYNFNRTELVSTKNAETLFYNGLDAMTNIFKSLDKFVCADDETCAEKQEDFQGVPEVQKLSENLKTGSAFAFGSGLALKAGGMTLEAITKQSSENSTYKQGKKKKKKSHLKNIGNGIGAAINETGNLMIGSGVIAVVSATIIDFQFKYEKIFLLFTEVFITFYLLLLPFFILISYSVFIWTWKDTEKSKKVVMFSFNATVYPYMFLVALSITLPINNIARALNMKYMPTISSYTNFDSDSSSMILGLIGPIFQIITTLIITFGLIYIALKTILKEVKPLVDNVMQNGFNNLEEFIDRKESEKFIAKVMITNKTLKTIAKQKQKDKE
ncbi:hypothetical protein [Moritella viscosa]|uniref:hypothetical protein n=1 Tax=Moritella viscosa TaxID=80854 RepID=UPI00090F38C1|nr:hypothetical protein [Moritella viscosa]SHO14426.1 DNA-directed RNA polymerase subunit beta-RNA polymerase subunit beta-Transcriptase subunit beta [Moritella viscosa]SHO18863.1 DNA-directed RNA polymerase subunit beta-RNA polymerase subunit beta-Transcriptase subunit beta [Moritella viscosa]